MKTAEKKELKINNLVVDLKTGKIFKESDEIGNLPNCNFPIVVDATAINRRFVNFEYASTRGTRIICVDSFDSKVYFGKGCIAMSDENIILIKNLHRNGSNNRDANSRDVITLFSLYEPKGVSLSGEFIFCHSEFKNVKYGKHKVKVIEARNGKGKITGMLMFDFSGEVFFLGEVQGY